MLLREIKYLPVNKFHNSDEFKIVNGKVELVIPIRIVSDDESVYIQCNKRGGGCYMRKRTNYYHEDEWLLRCATMVTDGECAGLSYMYFGYGNEGSKRFMLGKYTTDAEKYASEKHHDLYRVRDLERMKVNAKRVRNERDAGLR